MLAIFDHDGVLVDSLEPHQASWRELARRESLPLTPEFIHQTFGMTNAVILRKLLGADLSDADLSRYEQIKEECYRELARGQVELMPGVAPLLDGLQARGFLLAIGSSAPRENLDLTIHECGLDGRFATIVSSADIRHGKPDPEVFARGAERLQVAPSRCVVFEDAIVGIQAAKAAGMYAVGVGTTHALDELRDAGADEAVLNLLGYDVAGLPDRMRRWADESAA